MGHPVFSGHSDASTSEREVWTTAFNNFVRTCIGAAFEALSRRVIAVGVEAAGGEPDGGDERAGGAPDVVKLELADVYDFVRLMYIYAHSPCSPSCTSRCT